MRFMIQLSSRENAELGEGEARLVAAVAKYCDELMNAGVLLAVEGLLESAKGARISMAHGQRTVADGPFRDTPRLGVAFWVIRAKSKAEALAWAERCPLSEGDLLEVRQLYDPTDCLTELGLFANAFDRV